MTRLLNRQRCGERIAVFSSRKFKPWDRIRVWRFDDGVAP